MSTVQNEEAKPKKRLSGAARRNRARQLKSGNANNAVKSVGTDSRVARFIKQVEKKNADKPKDQQALVPVTTSRRVKKTAKVQEAIKTQAFDIVRQKLVASLMQILPQPNEGNWNNNNPTDSWNNNNYNNMNNGGWGNSNNTNNGGYWSNAANNNMNQGVPNMQGGWNKNNNRGASNSQGAGNNNIGRGVSNSGGVWSSSSNSNLNNVSNAWSNNQQRSQSGMINKNNTSDTSIWEAPCPEAPAPPRWNNNISDSTLRNGGHLNQNQNQIGNLGGGGSDWNGSGNQSASMWNNKWSDDPRNAGGREYFQGQQMGGNDNYFNDQQNFDEYEQSSADLKFAIMDMNMPGGKIVGRRQQLLKSAFNQALADVVLNADRRFPPIQIKFSRFIQDTYKISVASRRCVEVLQNLVDRLPSLWPGSKLRLVAFQPRVKLQKVSVFIRSGAIGRTSEEILLILERQNAGLLTNKWHVFHKKEKDDGVLLIVGIDKQSMDFLETVEGRVFFLTSNAFFKLGKKPIGLVSNGGPGNVNNNNSNNNNNNNNNNTNTNTNNNKPKPQSRPRNRRRNRNRNVTKA